MTGATMFGRSAVHRLANGVYVPFAWLFLATLQTKIDGQEAVLPFFRLSVLVALPFALMYLRRAVLAARFTAIQWLALLAVAYLGMYPFLTILFGTIDVRSIKDAMYTAAIYAILLYFLKRYFTNESGQLDMDRVSRFWVTFAVVHAACAIALWLGLSVDFAGAEFTQRAWLDGRLHGLVGTPSHLGPLLAIGCIFLIAQRRSLANMLAFGLLFVAVVMTGSRSSLIGLAAAAAIMTLLRLHDMRLRVATAVQMAALAVALVAIGAYFADQSAAIVEMATRIDPAGWEKSRPAMWTARLSEFSERGVTAQLFGSGHRSTDQTFNVTVEYLANYGMLYAMAFNAAYAMLVLLFFARAWRYRHADDITLVAIAVFGYLFSQGINYTFYKFVHVFQLSIVVMLVSAFERRSTAVPATRSANESYLVVNREVAVS